MDPAFQMELEILSNVIDEMDYYQLLKVPRDASMPELKVAYYRESRAFHPDKFFGLPDGPTKVHLNKISRRITEAWIVLRDPEKRRHYDRGLSGVDGPPKLRYNEESEEDFKRTKEEEIGTTPQGRRFYQLGMLDLQKGSHASAERHFKMALMYEPSNERFKEAANEAAKHIKADFRIK